MAADSISFYSRVGKRVLDVGMVMVVSPFAVAVLLLLTPLLAMYWRSSPFFVQYRIGRREQTFLLVKLKTMRTVYDDKGVALPDEKRLTPVGKILRRWSLDELPELWHILTGEMSWVGPRPLLPEYLPLYSIRQRKRQRVRPGLTGWAQIQGRNAIDWAERLEYDAWYTENMSLKLDLRILAGTLGLVLSGKGVGALGQATMPRFTGNTV